MAKSSRRHSLAIEVYSPLDNATRGEQKYVVEVEMSNGRQGKADRRRLEGESLAVAFSHMPPRRASAVSGAGWRYDDSLRVSARRWILQHGLLEELATLMD